MARVLTRPMFRKGGLSRETGIMSGLDRKGYAQGSYAPRIGYQAGTPPLSGFVLQGGSNPLYRTNPLRAFALQGATPIQTGTTGTTGTTARTGLKGALDFFKRGFKRIPGLTRTGAGMARTGISSLAGYTPAGMTASLATLSPLAVAAASPFIAQAAATGQRKKGMYTPEGEIYDAETGKITSSQNVDEMGFTEQELAGSDANIAFGTEEQMPKEMAKARDAKIVELQKQQISARIKRGDPVDEAEAKALGIDATTGEIKPDITTTPGLSEDKLTGDEESDLMKAYKEYLPVMEEALGGRPSTKSQWLALAKFGTGLMAQPGGDLIGAIGKAAQMPLDDLAKLQAKVEDKKTQAKLLAIQSAMKDAEPGTLGKAVKDIKKLLNLKGKAGDKAAFAVYEELQSNNTTAIAQDIKAYRTQAKDIGVNEEGYAASMTKLKSKYPELVGQFNEILPDPEDREPGYYIAPTGEFVRVIEKDGEIVTIGMDEPGFKDKPKKK